MNKVRGSNSKFCPKCKRFLNSITDFGLDKSRKDGLHAHCKLCRRGYRLLRKPIPERQVVVGTNWPTRSTVPMEQWEEYDLLSAAGVPITIIKPDGSMVDWGDLT